MQNAEPSPRQRLMEWRRALPAIWSAVDAERARRQADTADWPSIVFLPLEAAGRATLAAIKETGESLPSGPAELSPAAVTTQCLAAWRMTQGIYRIDPTLYAALIDTPISGDVPSDVLLYLPEWCVYVETPGMTTATTAGLIDVVGLWYWLDAEPGAGLILCIGIDAGRPPPLTVSHVPLVGTLDAAIETTIAKWGDAWERGNAAGPPPAGYADAARSFLPQALSLVLYLCSTAAEISGDRGRPGNPQPRATRRHGERLYPVDGTRTWDVGVRLGAALRAAMAAADQGEDGTGERHGVRPHIRRAHWHTFLMGPRDVSRRRDVRWMPPIPVAVEDPDDLPSVLHPVGKSPTD